MDLDELFGEGTELGHDVVVKARLRFRVHPPRHRPAQDIADRLVTGYDECLDAICSEIDEVLKHADLRKSERTPLVLALGVVGARSRDVRKAVMQPYAPGSRGGKWYRDGAGHIRYGEQPQGTFKQQASPEDKLPHVGHYRPGPFMGANGMDQDVTSFLLEHGGDHGFKSGELRLLGSWYGTDIHNGELFDAFLECAGLTREELKAGTVHLRFGAQKLTYEEAVFEFFAAQESLFMGENTDTGGKKDKGEEDDDGDWNTVLNDEIKPLLDAAFGKYEALKTDKKFQKQFLAEPDRLRRRFFESARRCDKETRDLANHVISSWDPEKQVASAIDGMRKLGLFSTQSKVDRHAFAHGKPHLRGSVMLNEHLLRDDSNPLLSGQDKLVKLPASQLMLLYAGAELHRRWDPDSRSYSNEPQADVGAGVLGESVLDAIAGKSKQWAQALSLTRKHLDELVDRLVVKLNSVNEGEGEPAPKPKKRTKKMAGKK